MKSDRRTKPVGRKKAGAGGNPPQKIFYDGALFSFAIIDFACRNGLKEKDILEKSGADPAIVFDPVNRIPFTMLEALFLHVREALGDEALGLHIFEKIEAARFGDLGILAMVAPTYGEALRAGFQIYRLVSNSFTTQVEVDEPEARVKIISHVPDGIASRGLVEAKMVLTVVRAPVQTGIGPLPLRKIHFEFPRPAYGEEFEPIFNCPVEFDRDENCAYFDAGILSKKMPGGNPEIQDRIYGKITSRLEGGQRNNLVLRVRDCFRENPAQVKLTAVARQLGLGERTLQLHLARIGESFRAIKEGICMEGAMRLLMEPELSIEDVAYRLGYEDTTSLYKAFRRWTGGTPRNMP